MLLCWALKLFLYFINVKGEFPTTGLALTQVKSWVMHALHSQHCMSGFSAFCEPIMTTKKIVHSLLIPYYDEQ